MYTQKELKRATAHIRQLARENGITEEDMRAEMKAAMEAGRNNPDRTFRPDGRDSDTPARSQLSTSLFYGYRRW